jgi:hypothetical protein
MDDESQTVLPQVDMTPQPEPEPQQAAPAPQPTQAASAQPGIIDRVHGLSSGLADLAAVLNGFSARLEGQSADTQPSAQSQSTGLLGDLEAAETNFQRAIQMAHTINAKF